MFPISFIQTLKLFIKFNLHSCSFWSINSASSGFWPFFHDSCVPHVLLSFLLSSCPLETPFTGGADLGRETRASTLNFMASKWVGKAGMYQGTTRWRHSAFKHTYTNFSSGHCPDPLPQRRSFPEVTLPCDDCQGPNVAECSGEETASGDCPASFCSPPQRGSRILFCWPRTHV